MCPMPRLLSTRTHFPITTLAIGARTQKNCTERLSPQVDLHGLSAGLAAHSRKKPTHKKRPSAMGMSDAECVARNIKIVAFKLWARRVGYSATKASFLSRTHMSLLCYDTPSHFLYSDKTNMCSPVRTLGVLPTYKHTSVRARKQAINCVQCPAC